MSKNRYSIIVLIMIILLISLWAYTAPQEKITTALRPPVPEEYRGIINPFPRSTDNILEGERLYDIQCSRCHGGDLDGKGPEAGGFFPPPADLGALVSELRPPESYLFWRIREGGRVLPREFAPWSSAMPAWKEELRDEEIWKVILYIYEATGAQPPQP